MYLTLSILHIEKLEKGSSSYKNHVTPPKPAFQGEVRRGAPNKKQLGSGIPPVPDTPQVGTGAPAFCVCHESLSLNSLSVKFIFHLLIGTPLSSPLQNTQQRSALQRNSGESYPLGLQRLGDRMGIDHHEEASVHTPWKCRPATSEEKLGSSEPNGVETGKAPGGRILPQACITGSSSPRETGCKWKASHALHLAQENGKIVSHLTLTTH